MRDFYVDDLLKSFETTSQAVEITKELQELLAKGGFQLTKVMSNEREVLNAFSPEHRTLALKNLDLNLNSLPMDRALRIYWDVEADTFNLVVSGKSQPETRRGSCLQLQRFTIPFVWLVPYNPAWKRDQPRTMQIKV
ncbi:uncharacterized protein LOC122958486 [Acropora millepora]|uniref:uncharacterized protein LOC122958486 n=1 Tax=Acropora millepora TaxID=45264 RepID=UPI001CF44502|nr:uncharacterized protein LOC122958486 [Acropora millepora]